MNCQHARRNLTNALATGESHLSTEIASHLSSCNDCGIFYEAEARLLLSIEAGLSSIVNQPVTPSLIPACRSRLDPQSVTHRAWIPAWNLAAVIAAVAILAFSLSYFRRRPELYPKLSASPPVASPEIGNITLAPQLRPESVATRPIRPHKNTSPPAPVVGADEASPEVIVLAEEREAFVRFVAKIPVDRDKALALTHPAPTSPDLPVEIALLQIPSVEVRPLEAASSE